MTANIPHPPGPRFGILGISGLRRIRDNLLAHCVDLADRFGDCVHYRLGAVDCFHFSHPDQIREVLVQQHRSFQRPSRCRRVFPGWYGEGILLNDGPSWHDNRQLVQQLLERGGTARHAEIVQERTVKSLKTWGSSEVDIGHGLARLNFELLVQSLWGVAADDMAEDFVDLIGELQRCSMRSLAAPVSLPLWIPGGGRWRLQAAMRRLDTMTAEILARHRRSGDSGILAELFRASDVRNPHNVTALNLLLGSESIATALTWTVHLLATHPAIQSRARSEVLEAQSSARGSVIEEDALPYLGAVFKEAIRLFPPAFVLIREAVRAVEIGRISIRRGSQVFLPLFVTQRDERWFAAANTFRPGRFLDDGPELRPSAYLPFGAGPRSCIGRQLAQTTAIGFLAAILGHGFLEPAEGAQAPEFEPLISLRPRTPIRIKIRRPRECEAG